MHTHIPTEPDFLEMNISLAPLISFISMTISTKQIHTKKKDLALYFCLAICLIYYIFCNGSTTKEFRHASFALLW